MEDLLRQISKDNRLEHKQSWQLSGGDINQAFRLQTSNDTYFIKINSADNYPGMFACEADGLSALENKSSLRVPAVRAHGITGSHQWLLLEWIEQCTTSESFWEDFGHGLAALHRQSHDSFGWHSNNFIGHLNQQNEWQTSWAAFYAQQRLFPLCKMLFDTGNFGSKEMRIAEHAETKLNEIFPIEPPALVHGDLWSGNFMISKQGKPVIYDPAVYYGHREMDIGMSLLFGGFDRVMYKAYQEAWPMEKNWKSRTQLTQLYPLLVHAVLFGGHYIGSASSILTELV